MKHVSRTPSALSLVLLSILFSLFSFLFSLISFFFFLVRDKCPSGTNAHQLALSMPYSYNTKYCTWVPPSVPADCCAQILVRTNPNRDPSTLCPPPREVVRSTVYLRECASNQRHPTLEQASGQSPRSIPRGSKCSPVSLFTIFHYSINMKLCNLIALIIASLGSSVRVSESSNLGLCSLEPSRSHNVSLIKAFQKCPRK